ncbi:hypothetical protein GCM10023093_11250 [Nemorincola caseinilytica]|uniref:Cell division protein ZapA n=1 Tax=Nemorincola caseinilytica TaxID=2054315 RepID=A0ABP8NAL1_9BACT
MISQDKPSSPSQEQPEEGMLPITVWLAGRSYRIRIEPGEESEVRKAIRLADQKITELRTHYAGKDDQDFIAMCLLSYATDSAIHVFSDPVLQDEIKKLSNKIDRALRNSGKEEE